MTKRRLRNAGSRPKAIFGSDSAAILAAAGINVAGSLAAAGIGASAAKQAAQEQAKATIQNAQRQAQAIKEQNASSKELQQQSQEFIKEQNAENRELQKDIQMQLQMLTGQQNVNDRLEASKLRVRNGGSIKRKLRNAGQPQISLRGGNMPFVVTDGGSVLPVGVTPEGFELYEIVGNDHEHYHKAQGGKNKTGVGIKFADGSVVEGEGNQNSNQGEYLLDTPDNAYFISRHSIGGINPAKMINGGMHPLRAYMIQEQIKAAKGISDDGKHNKNKNKKLMGGIPNYLIDMTNSTGPQMGVDTMGDTTVGSVYAYQNLDEDKFKFGGRKRCLKLGGRTKAVTGFDVNKWWANLNNQTRNDINMAAAGIGTPTVTGRTSTYNVGNNGSRIINPTMFEHQPTSVNNNTGGRTSSTRTGGLGGWINRNADVLGAGINVLGNIGGAFITAGANRSAARTIADAQNRAAGIMANAYNSLTGIDMDSLRREDYAAAHMMPALQAPVSFAASNIAGVDRGLQRRLRNAGRYSMSSAAAQERMANAETEAQDTRNRVYSVDQQQMQEIRQRNADKVTEASKINAMLDTQANQQYGQDYLKLLQYNNDINNTKILGAAGAISEGGINASNVLAQAQSANGQAWSNALANSGLTLSNTLSTMAKRRADLENTMLGATTDAQISYIARNGSAEEKRNRLNAVRAALRSGRLSPEDEAKYKYYESLLS